MRKRAPAVAIRLTAGCGPCHWSNLGNGVAPGRGPAPSTPAACAPPPTPLFPLTPIPFRHPLCSLIWPGIITLKSGANNKTVIRTRPLPPPLALAPCGIASARSNHFYAASIVYQESLMEILCSEKWDFQFPEAATCNNPADAASASYVWLL